MVTVVNEMSSLSACSRSIKQEGAERILEKWDCSRRKLHEIVAAMDALIHVFVLGFAHTQAAGTVPLFRSCSICTQKHRDSLRHDSELTTTRMVLCAPDAAPFFPQDLCSSWGAGNARVGLLRIHSGLKPRLAEKTGDGI